MKYLRVISDIHLDWYAYEHKRLKYPVKDGVRITEADFLWYPDQLDEDRDTCLILPGDLWNGNQAFVKRFGGDPNGTWLERLAKRFKYVVIVLGNHDYWGESLQRAPEKAQEHGIENVYVLERSSIVLDQVKFIGGTLWTDYNNGDPQIMGAISSIMTADHDRIMVGRDKNRRRVRAHDFFEVHKQTKRYIANNVTRDVTSQKVVVVTHMAPSYQSVNEIYKRGNVSDYISNFAYYSDLDSFIYQYQQNIDLWVHGHMHHVSEYQIGRTRVMCNPKGYLGQDENNDFNPCLRLLVDGLA